MTARQQASMHHGTLKLKRLNGTQPSLISLLHLLFSNCDTSNCLVWKKACSQKAKSPRYWGETESNCQCHVDSWVGGPTPSVPPSAGSFQEQLRLYPSPFCTIDHPQTADPVLAFCKNGCRHTRQQLRLLHTWENTPGRTSAFHNSPASVTVDAQAYLVC